MHNSDIAIKMKEAGLGAAVNAKDNTIELSLLGAADPLKAREILYRVLNGAEPFFTVFLKGLPFCFMPDAWDHILYLKKAGAAYARIAACARCRMNAFCPGLEKKSGFYKTLRKDLTPVLAAPGEVVIELTKKCNLNCRVCSAGRNGEERSFKELCGIMRQAKKMGVKNIRFTGGEPFLRKDLFAILDYVRKCGFSTSLMKIL